MASSRATEEALLAALSENPDDVNALDRLGMLAARTGRLDAALSALSRAAELAPHDAQVQIHLAHVYHDRGEWESAQLQYARALYLAPNDPLAHEGAAYTARRLNDFASAEKHRREAFRGRVLTVSTVDVAAPTVLLLLSSRGGNVDTRPYLAGESINVVKLAADEIETLDSLPEYDFVFHGISDCDLNRDTILSLLSRTSPLAPILDDARKPLLNHPAQVAKTGRLENSERLGALPGVRTARAMHLWPGGDPALAARLTESCLRYPLLVRSLGYQTGEHFFRVTSREELETVLRDLPGEVLLAMEFLDLRSADGMVRKYRMMSIAGALYPAHLAIARDWKVHYASALTAGSAAWREEERRFLEDPRAVLGEGAYRALESIAATLALDYAGIDFALDAGGRVVCFEANATMVVAMPSKRRSDEVRRGAALAIHAAAKRLFRL